jgi:two-component system sensor histidine kinase KdpD
MFRPFQRLGDTDPATGLGLGLAVARGFTEVMGGALEAESTPGGGLTMVVELPVATGQARAVPGWRERHTPASR